MLVGTFETSDLGELSFYTSFCFCIFAGTFFSSFSRRIISSKRFESRSYRSSPFSLPQGTSKAASLPIHQLQLQKISHSPLKVSLLRSASVELRRAE